MYRMNCQLTEASKKDLLDIIRIWNEKTIYQGSLAALITVYNEIYNTNLKIEEVEKFLILL